MLKIAVLWKPNCGLYVLKNVADEVVGVAEVARPADQVQVAGGAVVDLARRSPAATVRCAA